MQYSIRKKLFLITMATTVLSFLLVLLCFNYICSSYIEKTSVSDLNYAVNTVQATLDGNASVTFKPSASISVGEVIPAETKEIQGRIQAELKEGVELMVVSPGAVSSPVSYGAETESSGEKIVATIRSYALANSLDEPTRLTLDDASYYLIATPLGDSTAVLYKNIQPLEELAADVNAALLALLLISAVITVAASMGLSSGMVRSIRRLCAFADGVGRGNFTPQTIRPKERELAQLAQDMDVMAARLSAYDAEQKTFFQNASHELRTPLMSIQGYAEGITSGVFAGGEAAAAETILAESERLTSMVDDILYLSRMDAGAQEPQDGPFDAAAAVAAAIAQAEAVAGGKRIVLAPHSAQIAAGRTAAAPGCPPASVTRGRPAAANGGRPAAAPNGQAGAADAAPSFFLAGCQKDLERALLNLLTNGLRYANAAVTVAVDPASRTIRIADDGPGIAPGDLPHIFKRFYKGAGGCTGLGLSIARTVVDKLGGSITAANAVPDAPPNEKGAVFTLRF